MQEAYHAEPAALSAVRGEPRLGRPGTEDALPDLTRRRYGVLLGVVLSMLLAACDLAARGPWAPIPYSDVIRDVERGLVTDVYFEGSRMTGHYGDGRFFRSYAPYDPSMVDRFMSHGVRIAAGPAEGGLWRYLDWLIYAVGVLLLWLLVARPLRAAVTALRRIEKRLDAGAEEPTEPPRG